jgi:hypothetical protein
MTSINAKQSLRLLSPKAEITSIAPVAERNTIDSFSLSSSRSPVDTSADSPTGLSIPFSSAGKIHTESSTDHDNYTQNVFAPIDLSRLRNCITEIPRIDGPQQSTGPVEYALLASNEKIGKLFPKEFFDKHQGHGYVGLGVDQNYTLMGAARSERAWLIDINPRVQLVHQLNGLAFMYGENSTGFSSFFSPNNRKTVQAFLRNNYPNLAPLYQEYAELMFEEFRDGIVGASFEYETRYSRGTVGESMPSFLHPKRADDYAHVRQLFLEGRVHLLQGNIYEDDVLKRVADSANEADESVGITYMSNALSERYGDVQCPVLLNGIKELPRNKDSVLLNTWMDSTDTYGIPASEYEAFAPLCFGFWGWEPHAISLPVFTHYAQEKPSLLSQLWSYLKGNEAYPIIETCID